jgi:hypothetical protein
MADEQPQPYSTAPRPCAYCSQTFRPSWPNATYCTTMCRAKAKDARRKHGGPSPIDIAPPTEEG